MFVCVRVGVRVGVCLWYGCVHNCVAEVFEFVCVCACVYMHDSVL